MSMLLWMSNLLFWYLQAALLVLAAAFLPRLFRLRLPGALLAYWRVLLLLTLALPLIQPWHRARVITAAFVTQDFSPIVAQPAVAPAISHWYLPDASRLAFLFAAILVAGIFFRLLLLAIGLAKLGRLRRTSTPITAPPDLLALLAEISSNAGARAEFRLSSAVDSPVTFGLSDPIILLPERFLTLEPQFQAAIACHELLHVRRRDWAHHLGEEFLRCAIWFHPAIAWLIFRVRLAREQVVDREVVQLTQTRKTYLEALLEFTGNGRAAIAAIPAPPFLAERQLVERIALMLKEVRMSRERLIASFAVMACSIVLVIVVAVWVFPMKAAPVQAQSAPASGVAGGVAGGISGAVSGGVSNGIAGGIRGGVSGGSAENQNGGEPSVDYDSIWTDTVKRGPMIRQVRGLGKLVDTAASTLVARITLPVYMTVDVRPNQSATVDTRMGVVKGHVVSISPTGDDCSMDVALDSSLPERATGGLSVDVTIDIETLENVLYIHRPAHGAANTSIGLFKISKGGSEAQRTRVKLGRSSVNTIEILGGLQAGDKIILSDMSDYDNVDRIRLADKEHLHKN